jgi:hypothetical protein
VILSSKRKNRDKSGSIFIDNDPDVFRHLLQRTHKQIQIINRQLEISMKTISNSVNGVLYSFYLNRK